MAEHTMKKIRRYLKKWLQPLGLLWWKIDILYYDDPMEVMRQFSSTEDSITYASVQANWQYLTATIKFNLPALAEKSSAEIESTVVHELCHILICEMREDGVDHEERVATGLARAFIRTREAGCSERYSKG